MSLADLLFCQYNLTLVFFREVVIHLMFMESFYLKFLMEPANKFFIANSLSSAIELGSLPTTWKQYHFKASVFSLEW